MSPEELNELQKKLLEKEPWRSPNGFQFQETYDKEWMRIRDEFYDNAVFGNVDIDKREDRNSAPDEYVLKNEQGYVVIENAQGDAKEKAKGLWSVSFHLLCVCSLPIRSLSRGCQLLIYITHANKTPNR
jgi:hypothetical protein